ncbi:MAG: argininosuccinate lyase [Spirochaetia bacterium]|nr:argininosuccinate lyase [Spirochaetia bacterium]
MAKIWEGRFKKELDAEADRFNASISFDRRLFKHDVRSGLAHLKALKKAGIISAREAAQLTSGMKKVAKKEAAIDWPAYEDVHSAVEGELVKLTGDLGKKLHTGRSRNDLVATDTRMYMKEEMDNVKAGIRKLMASLVELAEKSQHIYMPGYTHLQHAQVVCAGQWLMAYFAMFKRDCDLFDFAQARADRLTLGCGALAGSNYPLDRTLIARETGFKNVAENSMDAVADRDFMLDFLYASSVCAAHLSRLAEELIIYGSNEFGFIEIDDAFATGSSIMPHKKNPDIPELIRGKTGKYFGGLMAGLTMMKGLPLAYNKDMQEDKVLMFSRLDELKETLSIAAKFMRNITIKQETINRQMADEFMYAVDIADYLVGKGLPFRESHRVVGSMVGYCVENNKRFTGLTLDELRSFSPKFAGAKERMEFMKLINPAESAAAKLTAGSTSPSSVKRQIAFGKKWLGKVKR